MKINTSYEYFTPTEPFIWGLQSALHAVWVLFISSLEEDKIKQREIKANTQHPHIALIGVAVLRCVWLYAACVEQQKTWLFIQANEVQPSFLDVWLCISGLSAPESSKQMTVRTLRDMRDLRAVPLFRFDHWCLVAQDWGVWSVAKLG